VHPGLVHVSARERADDQQLLVDAEISERRESRLTRFGAGRGQQQQIGIFESAADLAVVGSELISDAPVERFDRSPSIAEIDTSATTRRAD